jgi:phosphoenolpyruvate carboxykinase (ATP)
MRKDPNFGFSVPVKVDGINGQILDPKKTWQSEADYDAQAKKLVQMFISNFTKFQSDVEENVRASGPIAN